MRVLIISEPGESGVFTYVEALCHFLVEQGVEVHLGYSDRRGSDRLVSLVAFIEAHGGRTANMEVSNGVGPGDFRAFFRLWRLAAEVRPDVIHCHSSKAGALGRLLRLAGIPAITFYHPHAYYGMRPGHRASDRFYNAVEAVLGRCGKTIAVSSDEWRFAVDRLGIPPSHGRIISNGVDTERFRPADREEKLALRDQFGIPRGRVVLGAMSRMSAQKDPVTLYRAFAAACREGRDLHLLHVGSGELEGDVERIIAETGLGPRLTRLRYLSNPTGFYKAVDGFVLTSTYEGLSLASLEALAADLPLVLSRAPGNLDLVDLPLTHLWSAEPGNVPEFTAAFLQWYDACLEGRASNHRQVALERYDCRSTQAQVLGYYRQTLAQQRRPSAWWYWGPVILWLAMVAVESTDRFSRAHTRLLLYPPVHFVTGVTYADFYDWNFFLRKTGHVLLYGSLSVVLYRLWRRYVPRARNAAWSGACAGLAVLGTALVAMLDEWHQTFIPSRTGTVQDVMLDTGAAVVAQLLILGIGRLLGPPRGTPSAAGRLRPQSPPSTPTPSGLPGMAGESTESRARS